MLLKKNLKKSQDLLLLSKVAEQIKSQENQKLIKQADQYNKDKRQLKDQIGAHREMIEGYAKMIDSLQEENFKLSNYLKDTASSA